MTTPRVSRPNSFAAPNSEHHFLHRLLLHRRERRRRERQTVGENSTSSSGTPSTATRVATPTSTTTTGALWYRAFELFSEAVQQHHVSPTAQHLNLLLYIAQRHALWGQVDVVEEFWARLLSSVQRLRQEKMRDKRRVEQKESKYGEEVKKHGMAPLPETLSSTAALAHAQTVFTVPPFPKATSLSSTTRAALMRQLDELGEMEQALMPNAQTYELLLGSALVRGAWSRALEYCDMRTRSGLSTMTDASVRQVLQVYILAEASGAVIHSCTSFMVGSPPNLLLHRLGTGERGQGLRGLAAHAQSSKTTTARSGSAQDPSWLAALQFFRNSVHRVSSMHTVWSMATLLNCASQWAELVRVVRDDCQQLVQTSLRSLAAHALTSVERAALLRTLKMVSDAACDLGDWRTALQVLREVAELRRQLLPEHSAWLEQLWGLPHRSGESDVTSPAVAAGNSSSDSPSLLLTQPIMEYFASPDQMNTRIINDDVLLDEVRLSQHLLKNALLTLRRVRRYAQMIELYGATSGVPGVAVNGSAGTERAAEQDDSTLVWRSMWTPSAVGYVAQAALAVQDLDLLLGLCGLTADGETMVTEGARASLGIPAEVYDATLHLIQYHIIRLRCEAKKSMRNSSTAATAAAKGRGGLHWDVLSQRVYKTYRQRALQALAEEASPYRAYLERTTSEGDGHTVVVRNANVLAALAELDAPLLSSTHKPLVQLLAQSLQGGVDAPPVNATLQQQMLEHLQRIRCPDTLVIALAMDIVRTQARQRRFSDREAQTLLVGIQQVLNTVLVEQHMEPIQLVSTSPCDSVTRWVVGSGSAQRRQSSGHHRRLSGPASLAASSPGGANWVSELTPTHLLSLSTLTAAAAHMSLDALACVQPLTLLTYIPACVELAWLPSTAAPAQLQRAQQAAVQRADEELQKDAIVFTEHHPTTTDQITRSNGAVLGCAGGTADLRHTAVDASPFSIEAHGKSAVAHFVSLYTEFSSRKTNAVAASSHAVLDAAAQVLMQLQRSRACHPPTAAMSAFIEALRHAWSEKTSLVHGPPPRVTSLMLNAEVERVVVASLNAVVQQVGASTVSRWTMWGDCVDMLMTYIGPPFSAKRRQEAPTERTEATPETLRVLHMFIRLCDRAETDFVERVTMDWLLHSAATTRSSRTGGGGGGGGCAQGEHIAHSASKHSETAVDTVEQLRSLCLKAQEQFCCASSVPHEPFSSQEWESMQLLIGALVWACRRQAKSLVRRLYSTLVPWLDVVLWGAALPSSPSPPNCIQSVTVNAVPGVAEKAVLHQQLSSLCETALAACTTVAQCLSSGPRVEVLQDWPLQLRALRQLTDQGNSAAPLSHFSNRRKLAALVDSIAAVVVKLRRTWCYLLNELALDSHRLVSEAHQRRGASPTSPPLQPPASVLKRRRNIEDSAASFAEWSCAELLPRLVLSCLRACVEHEALSDTTPTTTPPTRGHFPSPRALVTAALHKILEAVWDVDFAAFVWQVKFRVREGTDDDGMRAQKLARLRARGYHALSIELAWLNGDSASQELVRHLYMWILFTLHSVSTTVAVTELCRDLVSLDAFHGIQLSSTTPRPFLLLFVQEVDMLTEAKVTEALASAYCTGSTAGARAAAAAAAASDASSSPVAALARMKDGRTAMEHLTNPLVHFTLSTLRAAQQAAQWVLYLILCEGTVDLQAAGNTTDAAQKPMGGDCAAMSHAAIPCARLLHRCLAWSGQTHVYPALLRVVEVAAHETLRGPEAVVSVFHHMERLGRAEEGVDEAAKDGETVPDTSSLRLSGTRPLDAFLAFYMHSTTMRRASPVSEQVCLAAVLACAAHTRTADAAAWLPPADLLTLLTAFPQVVSNHLITKWIQNRLSQHQTAVLTEWMLRFFWGGVVASSMDSSTACLKRYGVGAAAAADGDITTTTTVTLPLRRASMQWLLVTRGTTAPPPPQDEGGEAWNPSASNEAPSSSQPSATAVERIASLATMLGRSNEFFAVRVGGVVVSSTAAAAPPGDNSVSPFPEERPLDEQQQRHPGPRPPCALAVLTRDVLQNVSTRNAVQQLLNRYQCTNSTQRRPTRVEDTETDALVRVLPEDAQRSAKSTLQYRDDPAVSPEGDLASEASPRMAKSHAQPPVPTFPAASNEKAVALERWLDLTLARLTSETADLAPPPTPLPWVLRCPEQEEGLTWNALHTQLLSIIKNMYHDSKDGPHAAAQVSSSQHNLDTYTQRRATTLRSTLLRVLSRSPKQEKNPLTSPGIEKDVSVCVSSLLLLGYVLLPLQSLRPPPSMVEVSAVVRRELWRLLLPMVCNGASVSSACASSASRQRSRSFYSALVQFCVRPLVLDALPQPCLSTLATNQARTAAFEAAAYLVLLVHHMSTAIHCTQVFFFGTLTNTAASSASRNKLAGDATTVDALSNTARELHRLSERELYHLLQTSSASTLSLQEPPRMVYGLLVRAWMQAGVLLGDVRSLLWGGQRLATWSLQRRQEATALAWIAEGSAAVSGSTARLRSAAETDALAEWLCVLPVAVLVAEVCGVTRGGHTGLSEALYSLAAVLPLPSSFSSAPAASSHGASVAVARDGYVNLLLHWRQQLQQQNRETGTSSGHLGGLRQKRLSSPSPFAVILHGSVPANTTQALVDSVRRRVREYLAGSTISYPLEQQQQVTPLSCNITPTLRCGGEGGCIGSRGIITAAALSEAFQCVRNASEADMRAFMRLEAAKRTPASKDVRRGAPKKAMVVQAMWSLINRAALQRRQGCGAGSRDTASWVSFVPPETWQSYVLNLHPVVPHTVHFIPAAVTEVLMLESCITWTDGLAVLEHSLGTLHHTGATPVQQYMAQLLLERVRRTQQSPERPKAVDEREEEHHFCAKLETYTYTALQQQQQQQLAGGEGAAFPHWHLWSQHMARRSTRSTAALVCRIVDLLLMHHVQTTRTTTRGSNTRLSSVLAKHTLMEALRCGVHDPALTRALFGIFWVEQYPRVEGVHVFLSALRAAKLARSDALALEAMLTYLWISDQNVDTTQRREEWTSHVLRAIDECETRATVAGPHISSSLPSSGASAWQHLKVAARKAAELQGPSHRFSVEAHRATWKSWTVLCRLRVVPKDVALCVVGLFKQLDRITEVEELMVTTCYVK
ncbi:hypothetical protein JKF63_06108 [Porcisia hertigi]|uniref:Uncharacterized protein n=1 Tax=Porcisia hertigi TaxID=2761500 RepID=A0A836IBN9_9TRYP|nr:hypothetical protein JKF63_06108 [Porcisia hertigi]